MSNAIMYSNSENMIDFQFDDSEGDHVSLILQKDEPLFQINCKKAGSSDYEYKWSNQIEQVMQFKSEGETSHKIAFTWKKVENSQINSGLYVMIDDERILGPIVTIY